MCRHALDILAVLQTNRVRFETVDADGSKAAAPAAPATTPAGWDESNYAVTDKNHADYATMSKAGGTSECWKRA